MDVELVREIAKVHPAAAMVLLSFHPSYQFEGLDLYRGEGAMPGIPTIKTVELTLDHADEQTVLRSMEPLDSGLTTRVKWEAIEPDSKTLHVTITSELVDESFVPRLVTHPRTVVVIAKAGQKVLSASHQ